MQSLYNYQLREKENQQLKAITHQQREWLLIAVLLTFVLISFFIIYYIQGRYKHMQTLHRLRELEIIKEQQYRYSISRLEENKNKIAELEKQLEILNTREGINNEQLQTQKEQIEIENRKIELEFNKKEKAIKSLKESDIYRIFHQADSVSDLTKEDWEILQQAINNTYENFTNHLYALFPISNTELKICLLLKIGMPVSKIAILIGRTKSTVTSARKKLYEKMFNKKGTPDMFDKIIDDL
jgi:DNA-binding CsgD family transcriptional regulator